MPRLEVAGTPCRAAVQEAVSSETIVTLISSYGYWVVVGVVALESMGLPLPGETTLIAAAVYAGGGEPSLLSKRRERI